MRPKRLAHLLNLKQEAVRLAWIYAEHRKLDVMIPTNEPEWLINRRGLLLAERDLIAALRAVSDEARRFINLEEWRYKIGRHVDLDGWRYSVGSDGELYRRLVPKPDMSRSGSNRTPRIDSRPKVFQERNPLLKGNGRIKPLP